MEIKVLKSNKGKILKGIILFQPKLYEDSRGIFFESWNKKEFDAALNQNISFLQDNQSTSKQGVLRGLHYQKYPYAQGKLVRCVNGKVFDVAVDIRVNSETFGQWIGITLESSINNYLWIPEGFAHGFLSLTNGAVVSYKVNQYWMREYESTIKWDDPQISINWPNINMQPLLSDKDNNAKYIYNFNEKDLL